MNKENLQVTILIACIEANDGRGINHDIGLVGDNCLGQSRIVRYIQIAIRIRSGEANHR